MSAAGFGPRVGFMVLRHRVGWLMVAVGVGGMVTQPGRAADAAREITVLNRGVGGNSSRDGLARFQRDVESVHPQHLLLYFGINDALNSAKLVPVAEFRRNLQAMIDRARQVGVGTVVLTTPNPIVSSYVRARHPKHPEADLEAHLGAYAGVVRDLARGNGLLLADLGEAIRRQGAAPDEARSVIRNQANSGSADGVHLTPAGYRLLASLYADLLADKVRPGDVVLCFGDSITWGANVPGAGSVRGQTYPAWLWYLLNRPLGLAPGEAPPEPAAPAAPTPTLPPVDAAAPR